MAIPDITLVEFHRHPEDDAGIEVDTDSAAQRDESATEATEAGDAEPTSTGGSWLRRLGTLAALGGVGAALARRRGNESAADPIGEANSDAPLGGGDPVERIRESDTDTGVGPTMETDTDVGDADVIPGGTDTETVEDASLDDESGLDDAEDVGDAAEVGGADIDAVEEETDDTDVEGNGEESTRN